MPGLAVGVAVSRSGSYRSLMSDRQSLTRSEELRSVTSRHWDAFRRGDGQAAISRYSLATGVTMFGTDVSEYIDDPDKLVRYRRKEFEVLGNWPLGEAEIDAWTEDNVGWSVIRSTVGFGEASRALRVTLVFRLEGDDWRVIHQHWSVGSPNPEVFGTPLTYSLEQVAEAVESRRPDLAGWAAADGTITVVFTDIESSTALDLSFGDQAWIEVLMLTTRSSSVSPSRRAARSSSASATATCWYSRPLAAHSGQQRRSSPRSPRRSATRARRFASGSAFTRAK